MATKCRPAASPCDAAICDQKKRSKDATSTVPPLLLDTRNSARAGSRRPAALRNRVLVGRVEHVKLRVTLRDAEDHAQHFGAEAASAHTEEDRPRRTAQRLSREPVPRREARRRPSSGRRRASRGAYLNGPFVRTSRLRRPTLLGRGPRCAEARRFLKKAVEEAGGGRVGERHGGILSPLSCMNATRWRRSWVPVCTPRVLLAECKAL